MALVGGIMKRQGPQQPIINHIDVKSVDEYSSSDTLSEPFLRWILNYKCYRNLEISMIS
jgi:hypothetical protein